MSLQEFYLAEVNKHKIDKKRLSKIRDILFASFIKFKNTFIDKTNEYADKPYYVFEQVFKNPEKFKSLNFPIQILGVGDNRGAFLIDNVVVKVNIVNIDENAAEKRTLQNISKIPLGKYFVIPLLASDSLLGQTILFFPKCDEIDLNTLSHEQKLHLELVRQFFIDTDGISTKNTMKLGNGIVCMDVQTGETLAMKTIESNPVYMELSKTQYWTDWVNFINGF
jgi:hypothetical protein